MKLKEYMEKMNELIKENPECLELDIIYAKDDEGNGYDTVGWGPSMGMALHDNEEFCNDKEEWDEDQEYTYEGKEDREEFKPNAVCIN